MKNLVIFIAINSAILGGLVKSDIPDPKILSFNKYKVTMLGNTLSESETPTFINIGKDSVKFFGGFLQSYGIKSENGNNLETWSGWHISHTEKHLLCQSPVYSLVIHFSDPSEDTTMFPENLKPNPELQSFNIPDRRRRLHNMPIHVPDDKDAFNMPVYDPGPEYNGFILKAGESKYSSPKHLFENIKNSFFVLNDSIPIPKLDR